MPSDEAIRWTFCHRMGEPDEPNILELGLNWISRADLRQAVKRPFVGTSSRLGQPRSLGSALLLFLPGLRTVLLRHRPEAHAHGRYSHHAAVDKEHDGQQAAKNEATTQICTRTARPHGDRQVRRPARTPDPRSAYCCGRVHQPAIGPSQPPRSESCHLRHRPPTTPIPHSRAKHPSNAGAIVR